MTHHLDAVAQNLFNRAIQTGKAGELLEHLFDGDGATIDATTGHIVYLPADMLEALASGDTA